MDDEKDTFHKERGTLVLDNPQNGCVTIDRLATVDDAIRSIGLMAQAADCPDLSIDFSNVEYVKPISAALFARELRLLIARRSGQNRMTRCRGYDDSKSDSLTYLADIGFFDFIGISGCGKKVRSDAQVGGRSPYLAITRYNYRRFKVSAEYDPYRREYDYIAEEARKIAALLGATGLRCDVIGYAVCEVMRNAYEHSGSANFYAWGQSWGSGGVELVMMDDGRGILSTLKGKYPDLCDEKGAISRAVGPGVSGSDFAHNRYNNSGFGLYVLTELARLYGHICVASGDALVEMTSDGTRSFTVSNDGVLVGLHLDAIPSDAKSVMEEIVRKGDAISSVSEYPIHPSKETMNF